MNEDFLNTLKQTLTDTAEAVGRKTEELVGTQKIRTKILSVQRGIDRNYKMLGELIYQRFAGGEEMDEEATEICDLICEQMAEMSALKEELESKKRQNCCPHCGKRNPLEATFCMACGEKLPVADAAAAEQEAGPADGGEEAAPADEACEGCGDSAAQDAEEPETAGEAPEEAAEPEA